jgi:hypothetical protein
MKPAGDFGEGVDARQGGLLCASGKVGGRLGGRVEELMVDQLDARQADRAAFEFRLQ